MADNETPLLEMQHISKIFPNVKALEDVSLTVRRGTVHALMGENGAGKSTLMKCLFGIYSKTSGRIFLEGREVNFRSPKEALDHGVAMVHQELNQALKRNVMDNIWLGRYPKTLGFITSERKMYEETQKVFEELSLTIDPRQKMSTMSVAQRQMAEIAKAVSYHAKVIVLDEPTSSLTEQEVEHLFKIIEKLRGRGCGIIYISHKMEEILRISDDITIMRDGTHVLTAPAKEFTMDKIIKLMVGRELSERFPPKTNKPGDVILRVDDLTAKYAGIRHVSFTLRRGEILGLAGLAGAGRTEVIETLFGLSARAGGNIYLDGRLIRNQNPREAIANGFALLTEERRATGIFGILDICDNATIANIKHYRVTGPLLRERKRRQDTEEIIRSLRVRTHSSRTKIRTLSGGNQQKVILGRWLLTHPDILMLDEPTRGIDVGAKYEIYQLIIDLASRGKSVIVVSGELPELLGICDRICVMSGGELVGELDRAEATQEAIMALAAQNV